MDSQDGMGEQARLRREGQQRWAWLVKEHPGVPWLDLVRRFYDWLYQ